LQLFWWANSINEVVIAISIITIQANSAYSNYYAPILSYVNFFLHFVANAGLVVMVCFFTKKRTNADSRFPLDDANGSLLTSVDRRRTGVAESEVQLGPKISIRLKEKISIVNKVNTYTI
jgi:hypothetical protein